MGLVYRAEDGVLGRSVALKVLRPELADAPLADRLAREARILAALEHPGIVPVHDAGTLADGRVYYVMKLVRGERLDAFAASRPLSAVLRVFLQVVKPSGSPMRRASFIVTSSRPTSWSGRSARCWCSIGGSPGCWGRWTRPEARSLLRRARWRRNRRRPGPCSVPRALWPPSRPRARWGRSMPGATSGLWGPSSAGWRARPPRCLSVCRRATAPAPADRYASAAEAGC